MSSQDESEDKMSFKTEEEKKDEKMTLKGQFPVEQMNGNVDKRIVSRNKSLHPVSDCNGDGNSDGDYDDDGDDDDDDEDDEDDESDAELSEVDKRLKYSADVVNTLYLIPPMIEALKQIKLQPNDVIIAGFPKSGTNWLEQICHQIRTRGTDESFEELTDQVPLLQLVSVPLGYDLKGEQKGDYKLFKTHDILCHLPDTASTCKKIVMLRNPYDTLVSYYKWEPLFAGYDSKGESTLEAFFKYKFNYKKNKVPLTYWEFLAHWLEDAQNSDQCLFIFYENLCENFDEELEKIREFLGTELSNDEKARVKYLSSFEYMKQNESKFDLHGLRQKIRELASNEEYHLEESETPTFLNLGAKRNGKTEIPQWIQDIMNNEWQEMITSKFDYEDFNDLRSRLSLSK